MKQLIFTLLIVLFYSSTASSAPSNLQIQNTAIEAFKNENYPLAIEQWNLLMNEPTINRSELFLNIGNAYFKLKQYAKAVLYYEKSLKYNYNNAKTQQNLSITHAKMKLDTESRDLFFNVWLKKGVYLFSFHTLQILALVLIWSACILSIFYWMKKRDELKKWAIYLIIASFFIGIWMLLLQHYKSSSEYAIVMNSNITGYEESTLKGKSKSIPQGEKVMLLDQYSTFVQVELIDNSKWWLDSEAISPI